MHQPLIKWTGSKRPLAPKIISYFPDEIDTYYEPFVGGGSVFFELLRSNKKVNKYILSDINDSLIGIYKVIQDYPQTLIDHYRKLWGFLQENPDIFYMYRDYYNINKNPLTFFFLTRTCYNGTIRYNSKGEFNTSFHFNRKGMHPDKIEKIINYYHNLFKDKDITFKHSSYDLIKPWNVKDVVYLDPPYTNSKALYHGNIDLKTFEEWINGLPCSWFMNMNGVNGTDNEQSLQLEYDEKVLLYSGNSSFSRMKKKMVNVEEYFYYRKK